MIIYRPSHGIKRTCKRIVQIENIASLRHWIVKRESLLAVIMITRFVSAQI